MSTVTLSMILEAKDKASAAAKNVTQAVQGVNAATVQSKKATEQSSVADVALKASLDRLTRSYELLGNSQDLARTKAMALTSVLRAQMQLQARSDIARLTGTPLDKAGPQVSNASAANSALGIVGKGAALGLGAAGLSVGLSTVVDITKASTEAYIDNQRVIRATEAAYGSASFQIKDFSNKLSAATGFTKESALESAISGKTLRDNYGLSIAQTEKLIQVSSDLANVRGIGLFEAFQRVQSAIRGEAEAIEYLGITTNATYMKNIASNGAYRQTWETMTDLQKAQAHYNEILRQTAAFSGIAAQATAGPEGAFRRLETATHDLSVEMGKLASGPGADAADVLTGMARSATTIAKGFNDGSSGVRSFLSELDKIPPWARVFLAAGGTNPVGQALAAASQPGAAAFGAASGVANMVLPGAGPAMGAMGAAMTDASRASQQSAITRQVKSEMADEYLARKEAADKAASLQAALSRQIKNDLADEFEARKAAAAKAANLRTLFPIAGKGSPSLLEDLDKQMGGGQARLAALQRKAQMIDLAAESAQLPLRVELNAETEKSIAAHERLAAVQDRITQATREDLGLKRQLLVAQMAAFGPSNAAEDNQTAIRRLQLQAATKDISRGDARRQIRDLTKLQPRLDLNALDANQGVTKASRATAWDGMTKSLAGLNIQIGSNLQGLLDEATAADKARDAIQRQIDKINLLADRYKALLAPDMLAAQGRMVLLEERRADALERAALALIAGSNAVGTGVGLRSLREGGGASGGGTSTTTNTIYVDASGADAAEVTEMIAQMLRNGADKAGGGVNGPLPGARP